jgi:prepilin-type processing-associated H-X9-DG protein
MGLKMSEEERKEKRRKAKITIRSLLVALSCLCFALASFPLWNPIPHTPDYRTMCQRNLSELSVAIHVYAIDYDGVLPIPSKWCDLLIEHVDVSKNCFTCPVAKSGPCNYAMNRYFENIGNIYTVKARNDMVLLFETYPGWNQVGDSEVLTTANHNDKGCNVSFLDGHVAFVKKQDLHKLKWKPDETQEE